MQTECMGKVFEFNLRTIHSTEYKKSVILIHCKDKLLFLVHKIKVTYAKNLTDILLSDMIYTIFNNLKYN